VDISRLGVHMKEVSPAVYALDIAESIKPAPLSAVSMSFFK